MNTGAHRNSIGGFVVDLVVHWTAAVRQERAQVRGSVDDQWGRSESLDPDNVGDIADEGAGHRG